MRSSLDRQNNKNLIMRASLDHQKQHHPQFRLLSSLGFCQRSTSQPQERWHCHLAALQLHLVGATPHSRINSLHAEQDNAQSILLASLVPCRALALAESLLALGAGTVPKASCCTCLAALNDYDTLG